MNIGISVTDSIIPLRAALVLASEKFCRCIISGHKEKDCRAGDNACVA